MPHVSQRISVPLAGAAPRRVWPVRTASARASPAANKRVRAWRIDALRIKVLRRCGRYHAARTGARITAITTSPNHPIRDVTVGGLLTRLAESLPDREALVYLDPTHDEKPVAFRDSLRAGLRWTFRELEDEARLIARG